MPNGLKTIGDNAFNGCSSINSIHFGSYLTHIGDTAFYACSSIKEVHISSLVKWCAVDFESERSNPIYYSKNVYVDGKLLTELNIITSIKSIEKYAFVGCESIESIVISKGVTSIGANAFYGCINLATVTNNSDLNIVQGAISHGYVAYYADTVK